MFIRFPNLPPGDCLMGRNLFILSPNLPPGDCLPVLQPVLQVTNYLKVTPGDCRPRVQPVYTVSNSTYRGLSVQRAACNFGFKTYITGIVGWGFNQFNHF